MGQEKKETLFLVLLIVAIAVLIFTLTILVKNKNIITKDPLNYGMEVHNFTSCSCLDNSGKIWYSTDSGFINKKEGDLAGPFTI